MRVCPRCSKEYADTVAFCFADGVPTQAVPEAAVEGEPESPSEAVEAAPEELDEEPEVIDPELRRPLPSVDDEDATDAPSLSEVSIDVAASQEPEQTEPIRGPERISDVPLAAKEEPAPIPESPSSTDEEAFFAEPDPVVDDEPLEPVGRSNGLLIGMGVAAAAMLGVGGWLLWQSFNAAEAVTEVEPVEIIEPIAEPEVEPEPEEAVEPEEAELEEEELVEPVEAEEPGEAEEPEATDPEPPEPAVSKPAARETPPEPAEAAEPVETKPQPAAKTQKSEGLAPAKEGSGVGRAQKKGAPPPAEEDPWAEPAAEEDPPPSNAGKVGKAKKKEPAEDDNPWGEIE